ncbi:MAG: aspartate aminotransferase family protein [Ardenticatenia bacterium]|nr:aspartate aminotransferase family protein [Ardenticatenia bacterium]
MSGGYSPWAAAILRQEIWQAIARGSQEVMHRYTYGGNPLSCAVGPTVLNYIEDYHLVTRSKLMEGRLLSALQREMGDLPWVGQVRGVGLLIGVVASRRSYCRAAGVRNMYCLPATPGDPGVFLSTDVLTHTKPRCRPGAGALLILVRFSDSF